MSIAGLKKKEPQVKRIIGLDLNSSKMAFAIFDDKKLVKYGEVEFPGKNLFERINSANKIVTQIKIHLHADKIVFEEAIYVNNHKTVVILAYMYGAIVSSLADITTEIESTTPTEWGKKIGNSGVSRQDRVLFKTLNPGKSKSWYDQKFREQRKQITKNWVATNFNIDTVSLSDDVCDAIAIGASACGYV